MPSVPTSEPSTITAGETLAWTKTLLDFPATGFVLKYALQLLGAGRIALTATAVGSDHAVNVSAATTAEWTAGVYTWTSFAERGSGDALERYLVERGVLSILPSPLAGLGTSHASRMLALIEAALEGRIPNGLESTNIDGQEINRIAVTDLFTLRSKYRQIVSNELSAARLAAGLGNRRNSFARFTRVR